MPYKDTATLMGNTFNVNGYDSVLESSSKLVDNGQAFDQNRNTAIGSGISRFQLTTIISVITVIVNASFFILLPIYLSDLIQVGSDAFVETTMFNFSSLFVFIVAIVIRWCHTRELPVLCPKTRYLTAGLIGFLGTLRGVLMAYSSLPSRTRPELLGIIAASVLPNAVLCRYIILRKGVGPKRLLCAAIVLLGLFISLLPEIFTFGSSESTDIYTKNIDDLNSTDKQIEYGTNQTLPNADSTTGLYSWRWPLVLFGSTLPLALSYVFIEREIKSPEVSFVTLTFWTQVFNCLSLVALFWTALIPNFGTTTNIDEFLTSLWRGIYCSFSSDPSCNGCFVPAIIFIIICPCLDVFNILLTKYAEGAIYTTIVMASSKPLSTIFWALFIDTGLSGIIWRPRFGIETILTLVGLVIVVPATCLYASISNEEENQSTGKIKETEQR